MEHYVYIYLDTRKSGIFVYGDLLFDHEPFYIGQGKNDRYKTSLKHGSKYKMNKINKIIEDGYEPRVIKLYENLNFEKAIKLEMELINLIGRRDLGKGPLVNLTDGGEGTLNMNEEIKNKIREKSKKHKHPEEKKEKMRLEKKKYFDNGNTTWNKGKHWSDEMKLKLTNKSNSGKTFTKEHKNKMSENAKRQMMNGNSVAKQPIPVIQYTIYKEYLNEYESIKSASIITSIPTTSISQCCKKKLKHAGGFYWEYKNNK